MKRIIKWKMEAAERVHLFGQKPEIVLTAAETPIFASLATTWTAMKNWGAEQVGGGLNFRTGAKERREARDLVLTSMREVSDHAKGLEAGGQLPAGGETFRMPRNRSFVSVAATAQAFANNARPVKALFITAGLPATFVEDLEALLPLVDTATAAREKGLMDQRAGTAGLEALADEALRLIQQLRPMMRGHLKNEPALLGAWNNAARVWRVGLPEEEVPEEPGTESGTGTEFATASAGSAGGSPTAV